MGRGGREKASGATGLLFGPRKARRSESVSLEPPQSKESRDNALLQSLTAVVATTGLTASLGETEKKLRENNFCVAQNSHGTTTFYLRQAEGDDDLSGIRINYSPGPYEGDYDNLVTVGSREVSSLGELEQSLRQQCKEAKGIDYLEMSISGQEALDRFDRGEKIDLALKGDDVAARKQELKRKLLDMLDIGIIRSGEDLDELNELIALQAVKGSSDENLFSAIASSEVGRQTLAKTNHLDIRSFLV